MDCQVVILSESNLETNRIWETSKETFEKYSIGTVVDINEEQYILGINYSVKNSVSLNIVVFGDDEPVIQQADIVCVSPELNLCLLKFTDYNHPFSIQIDQFNPTLDILGECVMKFIDFDGEDLHNYSYQSTISNILFEKWNCYNMPLMPELQVRPDDDAFWEQEFNIGLEGTIVQKDDHIIGMLFKIYDTNYIAVPSLSILRFLNEFGRNGKFAGLCGLMGPIEFNDNEGVYEVQGTIKVFNQQSDRIKKGDKILGINNQFIDRFGNILDEKAGIPLPMSTYIALNFTDNELLSLMVNDRAEKVIMLESLSKYRIVPIESNNTIINIHGFFFVELSEDLLDLYRMNGIELDGTWMKYITTTPYTDVPKRVYICVHINKGQLKGDILEAIESKSLPLIKKGSKYVVASLYSINDMKLDYVTVKSIPDITSISLDIGRTKLDIIF